MLSCNLRTANQIVRCGTGSARRTRFGERFFHLRCPMRSRLSSSVFAFGEFAFIRVSSAVSRLVLLPRTPTLAPTGQSFRADETASCNILIRRPWPTPQVDCKGPWTRPSVDDCEGATWVLIQHSAPPLRRPRCFRFFRCHRFRQPNRVAKFNGEASLPWLTLVLLTALVLLSGGFSYHQSLRRDLRREAEMDLRAVATLKAGQIAAWRAERCADAAILSESPLFVAGVAQWLADPRPELLAEYPDAPLFRAATPRLQ
jgi:hypothetical protein